MSDLVERLSAALADRYVIERELGRGGMATVYLAEDTKHHRHVAIKVLDPELARALGSERFLREVEVTANLNHPHILPLHDSGEVDGLLYYVMPYVEGETLRDRITRETQLPLDDALRITKDVASALSYAHSHDVIHRDIKPENILLSAGEAVVADFGIARAITEAGGDSLTETGITIGTPAYMSPEQGAGSGKLDGRSDLYSLGCVLYEMLAGEPPYTGPTAQAVIAKKLSEATPRVSVIRERVPQSVEVALDQVLAKAPADRYATAEQLVAALDTLDSGRVPQQTMSRSWRRGVYLAAAAVAVIGLVFAGWQFLRGGAGPGTGVNDLDANRVAVLYFDDLSPDGDLGYVSDGLTEELIERLSLVQNLDVVSRNGVAQFRGQQVSRQGVATTLEAGTLIEGSVMPSGDRIRVTLFLVDGLSGADFERASFEIPASEFLAMQDSLAEEAARLLRERLGEEVELRERQVATSSVEAYAMLQRAERIRKDGENLLQAGDTEGAFSAFDRADAMLELAEAADPEWNEPVVLRSRIAYTRSRLASDPADVERWIDTGMRLAERVLAKDEVDAQALELRGTLQYWRWLRGTDQDSNAADARLNAARVDLESAVQQNPSLASAYATLSHLYYQFDDTPSALRAAQRAYEEDTYLSAASSVLWRMFLASFDLERLRDAQQWCNEGYRRFPELYMFTECQLWMMVSPLIEADVTEAWRLQEQMVRLLPEPNREWRRRRGMVLVGGVLARAGLPDSARQVLRVARTGFEEDGELMFIEAYVQALLGDYDESVDLLERMGGLAEPDYWWWRNLRDHPGFRRLIGESN